MNKKVITVGITLLLGVSLLSAYNPPFNGESLFNFATPALLSGVSSVTEGAFETDVQQDFSYNPSLIAGQQRFTLNAAYTALIQPGAAFNYGQTAQLGSLIATKYGVIGLNLQGIFATFEDMNWGNSGTLRVAYAKDLTDDLYVGTSLHSTVGKYDWGLNLDIGFWYRIKKLKWLPFMKDIRWAFALTGMGKPYSTSGLGINGKESESFPGMFTPRVGLAGTFLAVKNFSFGAAFDFAFPSFQNLEFAPSLQFLFGKIVLLNAGWKFNLRETLCTKKVAMPTIGISVKFGINTDGVNFMSNHGWEKTDIVTSAAYGYLQNGIHAASLGLSAFLGQKDTVAPEIKINF